MCRSGKRLLTRLQRGWPYAKAKASATLPDKGNYPKELEIFGNREFRQIFLSRTG
jgi:hypothetical protein